MTTAAQQQFPDLDTARLHLRGVTYADREFFFRQFSDPEVCRWMFDCEPFVRIEEADELIAFYTRPLPRRQHRWLIIRKADGVTVGTCGFHHWDADNNTAELGYDLSPAYGGQGYMAEAVAAAIDTGFSKLGLNRIQAFIHPGNRKSCLLVERLGFRREGIIRDQLLFRGHYYDHYSYSLLRRDHPGPEFTHLGYDRLTDGVIDLRLDRKTPAMPLRNWVPAYHFGVTLHDDPARIGRISLRVGHNEDTYYGGNIGYGINESHRGHGYAARACRLLEPLALAHGMDRLIITCDPDNVASRRTAENAGARLLGIVAIPPHNEMYADGEREKCRYEWVLGEDHFSS